LVLFCQEKSTLIDFKDQGYWNLRMMAYHIP